MNAEAFERKLRERAAYRREQLSDDIVAKTLEEVANALRESSAEPDHGSRITDHEAKQCPG